MDKNLIFYSLNSKNTKLWITGGFVIPSPPPPSSSTSTSSNESSFQGLFCSIISKLYYKCEIARLYLYDISLTLNEFIFLSSSAENVILNNVSIKYCNGEEVELEKLVQFCSKAVKFEYAFLSNATNFSSKTIKNLIKIPHFFMLKKFRLINIPDIFDIKPLLSFLKKTNLYVCLDFCENLSEDYRNQLNDIIVEILDETDNAYLFGPPSLKIPGINFETQLALFRKARYSEI
uniref:Uncharacterized protein n=1 Tax=Panagrolaimus superbus TaxID=310955 RepID=A0A914Z0J3_9BILA